MEIMDNNLENELFCLNYELKALKDILIYSKAERWVYGFLSKNIEDEHLERYNFILDRVQNKKVLDIACGSGYGSFLLATKGNAKKVVGVDIDSEAIKYANIRYNVSNIERIVCDATKFNYNEKFDVIVSYETIEHVNDFRSLLKNYNNLLNDDGLLYISTPITQKTTKTPENPYHIIEWSFDDFKNLLNEFFSVDDAYFQNIIINNPIRDKIHFFPLRVYNRLIKLFYLRKYIKTVYLGKFIKYKSFEKYTYKYDDFKIISGYQVLIAKKKIV